MKNNKVLYISPLIPAVSGSGGKRAAYNHLANICNSGFFVEAVFVDVDDSGDDFLNNNFDIRWRIFGRGSPKVSKSISSIFWAFKQLLFSFRPRCVDVVSSVRARDYIKSRIRKDVFDFIVVDHLNAFGLLPDSIFGVPVIYIAHNAEADIVRQRILIYDKLSLLNFYLSFEFIKLYFFERKCLSVANRIVLISDADVGNRIFKGFRDKVEVWPELPFRKFPTWSYSGSKTMLFVGSSHYFPNREALDWLIIHLMPKIYKIDPLVRLVVVGTSINDMGVDDVPFNVVFEGFVSDERLADLHMSSSLFISPIVLGSGVKIKVLEASSYGLPIAATKESLQGVNYILGNVLLLTRDPDVDSFNIVSCIHDQRILNNFSEGELEGLRIAAETRGALLKLD